MPVTESHLRALNLKAKLYRGLSDPSRLAILEVLREGALSVTEIVDRTDLSQPNASNHLACLHECGLVSREQKGRFVFYSLSDPRVGELLSYAGEILADVAKGLYECLSYRPEQQQER